MQHTSVFSIVAAVFSLLISSPGSCADVEFKPGASWLRMEENSRLAWVWGASEGQDLLLEGAEELKAAKENRLPSKQADTLAKIMTQYYQDAANTYIPWKYMAVVAAMKLSGKSQADLDERMRMLREYATWARSQREQSSD